MVTVEPIRWTALAKSCMIVFVPQVVLLLLVPLNVLQTYRLLIVGINVLISTAIGWRLYKAREHLLLTYDNSQFILKKGSTDSASHRWSEFRRVSLARSEHGDFSVRLYRGEADFFAIPVSKLKLEPFRYRDEATQLVASSR